MANSVGNLKNLTYFWLIDVSVKRLKPIMKRFSIAVAGCLVTLAAQAQMVSSTDVTVTSGVIMTVNEELTNTGTFQLEGDLHLRKGVMNQGQMVLNGQVVLNGNGTQSLQSMIPLQMNALVLGQTGKVLLKSPLQVNNQLVLGDGILENSESALLMLGSTAKVLGGSNNSHIKGYMVKQGAEAFRFPVGDGSRLQAFSISKPASYEEIQVGYVRQRPERLSTKLSSEVEEFGSDSYWSVKNATETSVQVTVPADDSRLQLLQMKNNQWAVNPSTLSTNAVSSEAVLKGTSYFTVGTQRAELAGKPEIGVFPNPSNGVFEVKLKGFGADETVALDIVDITGKTIVKQEGQVKSLKTNYSLDKDAAGTGNYFLRVVRPEKNQVFNEKVSINR